MTIIREFAPAKVNLTLHVTGQRADGYHLLDSLVVFAGVGDWVEVRPAGRLTLTIDGPEAPNLAPADDNLVLRAARLFRGPVNLDIRLTKNLPVSSGIGGGSADAAAALRAISRVTRQALPDPDAVLSLGADVPVCLTSNAVRMQGIGEVLTPLKIPADLGMVLVNPRVAIATPDVFRGLASKSNPPMPDDISILETCRDGHQWFCEWVRDQRNDLQGPAIDQAPVIAEVVSALDGTNPLLARMSGSGATCFALFKSERQAQQAANMVRNQHPDWWVQSTTVN